MTETPPSQFVWATVTGTAPLRIRLDGAADPLDYAPATLVDPAALAVDDRVRCEIAGKLAIVHGRVGGDRPQGSVGRVEWFAGATAPSSAWLLCDGAAVDRDDYAELFAYLGTTHGAGDGTTTFNLPDLLERGAVGASPATSVGTVTFTSATDLVNRTAHGMVDGDRVYFSGGTMPGGLTALTRYFVVNSLADTFQVAASRGGAAINITSAGSGTRTLFVDNFTLGFAGGEKAHTITEYEGPSHQHNYLKNNANAVFTTAGGTGWDHTTSALTDPAGNDRPHNNLGPYLALSPFIVAVP